MFVIYAHLNAQIVKKHQVNVHLAQMKINLYIIINVSMFVQKIHIQIQRQYVNNVKTKKIQIVKKVMVVHVPNVKIHILLKIPNVYKHVNLVSMLKEKNVFNVTLNVMFVVKLLLNVNLVR